jgi:hypothetical protein
MPMDANAALSTILAALEARALLGLLDAICTTRGVTRAEICGRRRTKAIALARHELWWHLHHHPTLPLGAQEIGRIFDRNRTSVLRGLYAYRRARRDPSTLKPLVLEPRLASPRVEPPTVIAIAS